eukprot:TRINITY_DN35489_c0_g1_i1.p1 TRINITY_DN35489_c0_g1~~TRINITY_DN35489_c0_g1_i1.p1  ORF type:complete len:463 (+),score=60.56 TRINITY_DN35489_c0_g1_i1:112-1500(+)
MIVSVFYTISLMGSVQLAQVAFASPCAEPSQTSMVDINVQETIESKDLKPLTFFISDNKTNELSGRCKRSSSQFSENRSLVLTVQACQEAYTEWANQMFRLDKVHLHSPSETKIKGERYDLEARFVHLSSKGDVLIISQLFRYKPIFRNNSTLRLRGRESGVHALGKSIQLPEPVLTYDKHTGPDVTRKRTAQTAQHTLESKRTKDRLGSEPFSLLVPSIRSHYFHWNVEVPGSSPCRNKEAWVLAEEIAEMTDQDLNEIYSNRSPSQQVLRSTWSKDENAGKTGSKRNEILIQAFRFEDPLYEERLLPIVAWALTAILMISLSILLIFIRRRTRPETHVEVPKRFLEEVNGGSSSFKSSDSNRSSETTAKSSEASGSKRKKGSGRSAEGIKSSPGPGSTGASASSNAGSGASESASSSSSASMALSTDSHSRDRNTGADIADEEETTSGRSSVRSVALCKN